MSPIRILALVAMLATAGKGQEPDPLGPKGLTDGQKNALSVQVKATANLLEGGVAADELQAFQAHMRNVDQLWPTTQENVIAMKKSLIRSASGYLKRTDDERMKQHLRSAIVQWVTELEWLESASPKAFASVYAVDASTDGPNGNGESDRGPPNEVQVFLGTPETLHKNCNEKCYAEAWEALLEGRDKFLERYNHSNTGPHGPKDAAREKMHYRYGLAYDRWFSLWMVGIPGVAKPFCIEPPPRDLPAQSPTG